MSSQLEQRNEEEREQQKKKKKKKKKKKENEKEGYTSGERSEINALFFFGGGNRVDFDHRK